MEITSKIEEGILIVTLSGNFLAGEEDLVGEKLKSLISPAHCKVVVDMEFVSSVTSQGLAMLILALKTALKLGGDVVLCSLQRSIAELFELTRFHKVFEIYPSEIQAIASFSVRSRRKTPL